MITYQLCVENFLEIPLSSLWSSLASCFQSTEEIIWCKSFCHKKLKLIWLIPQFQKIFSNIEHWIQIHIKAVGFLYLIWKLDFVLNRKEHFVPSFQNYKISILLFVNAHLITLVTKCKSTSLVVYLFIFATHKKVSNQISQLIFGHLLM